MEITLDKIQAKIDLIPKAQSLDSLCDLLNDIEDMYKAFNADKAKADRACFVNMAQYELSNMPYFDSSNYDEMFEDLLTFSWDKHRVLVSGGLFQGKLWLIKNKAKCRGCKKPEYRCKCESK